jgi:hypothetical protein
VFGPVAVLLIGVAFAAVVAWRIKSGKSYNTLPPVAVFRNEDPLSFWLSLLFPLSAAVGLTLLGIVGLWKL